MSGTVPSKKFVRKELLERRRSLPEDAWLALSSMIVSETLKIAEIDDACSVMVYLSIVSLREVETSNLCRRLHDAGKCLCVPALIDGHIVPVRYRPGDPLASGMFGQPEPTTLSMIDPQELEAVIVPLVGIDAHGYRMGYGKGFYDRFLAGLVDSGYSPCRIGLGFRMQFVSDLPADPWDEPLDYAVHEGGIVQFT